MTGPGPEARAPTRTHRTSIPAREVPRLALRPAEAAASLGVSGDYFRAHISDELRWIRRGRVKVVSVVELERWLERNAARVLEDVA